MKYILFSLALMLTSCSSEYHEPDFHFRADFNVDSVNQVEGYFKDLAVKESLQVFEKSRREMRAITQGRDAFYLSYYVEGYELPVLWVTNSGAGVVLDLGLLSNEAYPLAKTEMLANRIVVDLKEKFGIEMVATQASGVMGN